MSDSFGASALKSTGPSIALDKTGGAGGVGTFKGVMLCNRPFGGTEGAAQKGNNSVNSFRAGKVPDPVGVANLNLKSKIKRPKIENALTRHKKWLAELQRTKDRLEAEYTIEKIKEDDKKAKFQERERQMRLASRAMLNESKSVISQVSDSLNESKVPETNDIAPSKVKINDNDGGSVVSSLPSPSVAESKATTIASSSSSSKKKNTNKPAWAYAKEEEAVDMLENKELEDDEGLLDFANDLDFDKYMDDVEIKTMMDAVAKRIGELEVDVKNDDERVKEAIIRQALRQQIESQMSSDAKSYSVDGDTNASDEALNFAKQVLADMDELGAVHSTASVAQLYKQAKEADSSANDEDQAAIAANNKINSMGAAPATTNDPTAHKGTPHIAVHQDDEGERLKQKDALNKLPYKNRNPAV